MTNPDLVGTGGGVELFENRAYGGGTGDESILCPDEDIIQVRSGAYLKINALYLNLNFLDFNFGTLLTEYETISALKLSRKKTFFVNSRVRKYCI